MKKKKDDMLRLTKMTPEARKRIASSGVRLRAVTFDDKRQKLRDKAAREDWK